MSKDSNHNSDSNNPNAVILGSVVESAACILDTLVNFPWKTAIAILFVVFSLMGVGIYHLIVWLIGLVML